MALTASRVMQRVYRELGWLIDITATGGNTTTIIDTNSRYTVDDSFLNGTAFVVTDAGGLSAAPEGEFRLITDYVASTKTFTVGTAFSAAIVAGDSIGLARSVIPGTQMLQAVNDGLQDLGYIALVNSALTSDANGEISLPVGLKYGEPYDVEIEEFPDLPFASQWVSIKGQTRIRPSAPGSAATLFGVPSGYSPVITYKGTHPMITAYNSVISETIPEAVAVAAAANKVLGWITSKRGEASKNSFLLQKLNDMRDQLAQAKIEVPVSKERSRPKWFTLNPYVNPRSGSA